MEALSSGTVHRICLQVSVLLPRVSHPSQMCFRGKMESLCR